MLGGKDHWGLSWRLTTPGFINRYSHVNRGFWGSSTSFKSMKESQRPQHESWEPQGIDPHLKRVKSLYWFFFSFSSFSFPSLSLSFSSFFFVSLLIVIPSFRQLLAHLPSMSLGTVPSSSVSSELELIGGSLMSLTLPVALACWIVAWQRLRLTSALVLLWSGSLNGSCLQEAVRWEKKSSSGPSA